MKNLPSKMLVVSYMYYKKYKSSFKIFTDYLKGLPHLKYDYCNEYKDTILYILPKTITYQYIIQELEHKLLPSNIGHATYEYVLISESTIVYKISPYHSTFNAIHMPISINIPIKDKEHFIEITKR